MKKAIYGLFILVLVFTVLVVPSTKVEGEGTCGLPIDKGIIEFNNFPSGMLVDSHSKALTKEDIFDYVDLSITTVEGEKECILYNDDFEVVSGLDEINSYIEAKEEDYKEFTIVFKLKDSDFEFNADVAYSHEPFVGETEYGKKSINYNYKNGELIAEKIAKLANIPAKINTGSEVISTNYYYVSKSNLAQVNEAIIKGETKSLLVYLYFGYDDGNGDSWISVSSIIVNITDGKVTTADDKPVVNTSTSKPETNNNNGYMLGLMFIALGGISTIIIKKKKTAIK